MKLTDHFSVEEFACLTAGKPCSYCGGAVIVNDKLFLLASHLEMLRTKLCKNFDEEVFIYIVSGHRCVQKNMAVSTCIPHFFSMHLKVAADIKAKVKGDHDYIPPKVVYGFADLIFKPGGVGLYKGHVHVDVRGYAARW